MSHAANLRTSQRAQAPPTKKQKLSENGTRPVSNSVNGSTKDSIPYKLSATPQRSAKESSQRQQDDTKANIGHVDGDFNTTRASPEVVEISSGDSEDEDDEEDTGDPMREDDGKGKLGDQEVENGDNTSTTLNGRPHTGVESDDESGSHAQDKTEPDVLKTEDEEPSFGDLLRARGGETVDISGQEDPEQPAQATNPRRNLATPSANSLGTVLSQALRTNDVSLLESCLHVSNLHEIRATIERLPSPQASTLLQKCAERMHKRPGRAGSLMVWIQWTIVSHGGYLATQPAVMHELNQLYRVVKTRATALPSLLALKGKLDMLEAQLQLRRNRMLQIQESAPPDDDDGIIYVEGDTDDDPFDTDQDETGPSKESRGKSNSKQDLHRKLAFNAEDDADDEPFEGGVVGSEADDAVGMEEEDDEDEDEDLIDDEAESTDEDDEDDLEDEDIDFSDVDAIEGDESSEDGDVPPSKKNKTIIR